MSDEPVGPLAEDFREAVTQRLADQGFTVTRWYEDGLGLDCESADGQSRYLGFSNLYRKCLDADRSEWPTIIDDFLEVIMLTVEQKDSQIPDDLAQATDRLLVRVGKPFEIKDGKGPWQKRLPGTELVLNLVIDSPRFMTYVTLDAMKKSDRPAGEWLDTALTNLKRTTPDDWITILDDTGILCGHCNDSYDAARALILSELREPAPTGWLVCIPARDWMFALPATLDKLEKFHLLKVLAEKNYESKPYPVSDEVFWVRGRKWQVFKMEIDAEGVRVYPSDEFARALGMVVEDEPTAPEGDEDESPSI
jgi:hypothetical protein